MNGVLLLQGRNTVKHTISNSRTRIYHLPQGIVQRQLRNSLKTLFSCIICRPWVIHITRLSDIRLPTVETLGYYQPPTDFQSIQITCILPDRIGRKIRQFLILYPVLVSTIFKLQTLNTSNNYNINNISHFC